MDYRERLGTPAWWWIVGLVIGVSTATAMGFYLGPGFAVAAGVLTGLAIVAALWSFGRTVVQVDAAGLRVGESLLEWPYVGAAEVLDADDVRRVLGPEADARAYVRQPSWVGEGVRVVVEDAADPHPYWVVGSRRPQRLAAAIRSHRGPAS